MGNELKTLKDFGTYILEKPSKDYAKGRKELSEDLKQEVIKWIKECLTNGNFKWEDKADFVGEDGAINWIKHFFNITRGDLK